MEPVCAALLIPTMLLLAAPQGGGSALDEEPREPPFQELGSERLPAVETTCGAAEKDYILEVNGGGLALADFDRDGDHDLFVVDGSTLERGCRGQAGPGTTPLLERRQRQLQRGRPVLARPGRTLGHGGRGG